MIVIYKLFYVNYDLIKFNKIFISLLISNHIENTLCSYSFLFNIHLVTLQKLYM